ncbi:MAG: hypothetical protein NVS2B8_08040 [Vulcanimicrobiaceae bacterium]
MDKQQLTRGNLLAKIAVTPIVIGALAALTSEADAKAPQKAVMYQNAPKDGKKCNQCKFYIDAKKGQKNGACTQVAGAISPNGYCVVWAKGEHKQNDKG